MEIVKTSSTSCDPIFVIDFSSFNKDKERPGSVQLDLFWLGDDNFVLYPHTTNREVALFSVTRKKPRCRVEKPCRAEQAWGLQDPGAVPSSSYLPACLREDTH